MVERLVLGRKVTGVMLKWEVPNWARKDPEASTSKLTPATRVTHLRWPVAIMRDRRDTAQSERRDTDRLAVYINPVCDKKFRPSTGIDSRSVASSQMHLAPVTPHRMN